MILDMALSVSQSTTITLKYLNLRRILSMSGSYSQVRVRWHVRLKDQCCISSDAGVAPHRSREERAEPEGEALNFPIRIRSNPHLWSRSQAFGSD